MQDPGNSKRILLVGINAENIRAELADVKKDYSEFNIILQESKKGIWTEYMTGMVKLLLGNPHDASWYPSRSYATTELLVSATENKTDPRVHCNAIYAVVAAHFLFSNDDHADYANQDIRTARQDIEGRTTRTHYQIDMPEAHTTRVKPPPLFCFRRWFNAIPLEGEEEHDVVNHRQGRRIEHCLTSEMCGELQNDECCHLYMNDIALLEINREEAVQIQEALMEAMPNRLPLLKVVGTIEEVYALSRGEHEIAVENSTATGHCSTGHLVNFPKNLLPLIAQHRDRRRQREGITDYGVHMVFVLTSTDEENKLQYVYLFLSVLWLK